MSSSDEDGHISTLQGKARRIERACDVCRRRKIRCEGPNRGGQKCVHCHHLNLECTYDAPKGRRGPTKGYVRELESRLLRVERILERLHPETEPSNLSTSPSSHGSPPMDSSGTYSTPGTEGSSPPSFGYPFTPLMPSKMPDDDEPFYSSDDDEVGDLSRAGMSRWLQRLDMNAKPFGYQGKSSRTVLVKEAFKLRSEYLKDAPARPREMEQVTSSLRPEMWQIPSWELHKAPRNHEIIYSEDSFSFPEPDLLDHLVESYFRQINIYLPLFNKILFKRYISEGLHLTDSGFGSTVLLVAALGSRASSDPRVYAERTETHSAGWKWFNQVQQLKKPVAAAATLYDLQVIILTALFLYGSSTPAAGWVLLGTGIRLATDVGAHRQKTYGSKPTIHSEQWKRVFWCLVMLDRQSSINLGRPCAIHDEDFDLDLPYECDDEYWFATDPEQAFKQPSDKPCSLSFFIHLIKFSRIVSFVLRTLYATNKSKILISRIKPDSKWEEHIVTHCDSALNEWADSIPDHLHWDPKRENLLFFNQSSVLSVMCYQLQITIHRQFIPWLNKGISLTVPSLMICANAARSIGGVFGAWMSRTQEPTAWQMMPAFVAGTTLLLHIWGRKQKGLDLDLPANMDAVYKCMGILKICERVWRMAGRQRDALCELCLTYGLPLPDEELATRRSTTGDSKSRITSRSTALDLVQDGFPLFATQDDIVAQGYQRVNPARSTAQPASVTLSPTQGGSTVTPDEDIPAVSNTYNQTTYGIPLDPAQDTIASQWTAYAMPLSQHIDANTLVAVDLDLARSIYADAYSQGITYDTSSILSQLPPESQPSSWNIFASGVSDSLPPLYPTNS